jgi:hypothetical protein
MSDTLAIEFSGASYDEANQYANSLTDLLRDFDPSLPIQRIKPREETQDIGTVLQIVLGATSLKLLADGLAAWLHRNSGTSIVLKKNGAIISHLDSKDAPLVMEQLVKNFHHDRPQS